MCPETRPGDGQGEKCTTPAAGRKNPVRKLAGGILLFNTAG